MSKKICAKNTRKNFIVINEHFICENCQTDNPLPTCGCRNHCRKCLYSKHVDLAIPGDRLNPCQGLMKPISLEYNGKKGYVILHRCEKCENLKKNKAAQDDDFESIIKLSSKI